MKTRVMLRMAGPIIAVSVLLLLVGVVAAWYVHWLDRTNSDLLDVKVKSLRAAQDFEIGIREIRTRLNDYLRSEHRGHLEAIPALRREVEEALNKAESLAKTEAEQYLMREARNGYVRLTEALHRLPGKPFREQAQEIRAVLKDIVPSILEPAHDYLTLNSDLLKHASAENQRTASRTVLSLLVLGVCGAAAGLLAGLGLASRFRRSMVKLSLTIGDAAGKLNRVAEPVTLPPGEDFAELEATLGKISERISQVVQELQQSQREVMRAEQLAALGQLAAGLAHELRNPLTAIKILVQSAASRGGAGRLGGSDLAILEEEITRLEGSIQNFLDFARPPRLEKTTFDLAQVVEQVLDLINMRARQQGVRLETSIPPQPVVLDADREQIRQVVLNLLLNALDVLPKGGTIHLHVDTISRAVATVLGAGGAGVRDGQRVTLRVADTGPGLPPGLGNRIFEPFVSTKETGLGLGLSTCKRIAEGHGGSITAASRPEGGTVFTVQLPLAASNMELRPPGPPEPARSGTLREEHAPIARRR